MLKNVEDFCIYIHQWYCRVVFFFCAFYVWFWYLDDGGLIESVWKCSFLFSLLKEFRKDRHSVQFSSFAQSCPTLCNPMDCSMPGLPVHRQLTEFTQTHIHWVSDAIQPSHPLLSPSPPAFNLSQHQGLFKWVHSAYQVAKILNTQDWSPLGWTGWISLQSKGLPRVFSNTTVQKHQFFGAQLSL